MKTQVTRQSAVAIGVQPDGLQNASESARKRILIASLLVLTAPGLIPVLATIAQTQSSDPNSDDPILLGINFAVKLLLALTIALLARDSSTKRQ